MRSLETREKNRVGILLATLYVFTDCGKNEVSISEFQESIEKFQKKCPLGYSFSKPFLLSTELLDDLRDLDYRGYIRDYHYKLDGLLPKRFISLTPLGKGRGKRFLEEYPTDLIDSLKNAVDSSIKNYAERWRLWVR